MNIRSVLKSTLAASLFACGMVGAASASPTFVGSWIVGNGPLWTTNPTVYSGKSAAAFLFGGVASDYAISTIDNNPVNINGLAFLDGWGDTQYLTTPQDDDFSFDLAPPGYANPSGTGNSYSAYVLDHTCFNRYNDITAGCQGDGVQYVNYAFRVDAVPEPASLALLGLGLAGLGFSRRKKA